LRVRRETISQAFPAWHAAHRRRGRLFWIGTAFGTVEALPTQLVISPTKSFGLSVSHALLCRMMLMEQPADEPAPQVDNTVWFPASDKADCAINGLTAHSVEG
jgi:hypothetical protein